jgi:hypothetical protein
MADAHVATRPSSEWALGPLLETAARYVTAVRGAPGTAARARAALSAEGPKALAALLRALPVVRAPFSEAPGGRELHGWFGPSRRLPVDRAPVAVLRLPATNAEYLRGRSRQALRTNVRRATEAGVVCSVVTSPSEISRSVGHLAARRDQRPGEVLRTGERPGLTRVVWVAYDSAGDPVGLSETVLDGSWAGLGALVTASAPGQARILRYLLHAHTVEQLIGQEVTSLTVAGSMLLTSEGTRYFQRRTGFEPVWLRPVPAPRSGS